MNTRFNFRSLLNTAFGLLATCLFVSCSWVEELRPDEIRSSMIEISVASADLTKATPTDGESAINSLYIYAFQGDKKVGFLKRSTVVPGEPFYMDLQLPEKGTHSVDFFLVANAEEMDYLEKDRERLREVFERHEVELEFDSEGLITNYK